MTIDRYEIEVYCPSVSEFADSYPQYGKFAGSEGNEIFDRIMTAESFTSTRALTNANFPAVTGIAYDIEALIAGTPNINFLKQYIGAVVCSLMEANGYTKTGRKRSIPHPLFTKGEMYELR